METMEQVHYEILCIYTREYDLTVINNITLYQKNYTILQSLHNIMKGEYNDLNGND